MYAKKEKIYPAYVSKHNSNHQNHVIALVIPDIEKRLEFNQYQKSLKAPFIINADLECIIKKVDLCKIILNVHLQQK